MLDEPAPPLDVSVRAWTPELPKELLRLYNLAYVFISHDIAVAEHMSAGRP